MFKKSMLALFIFASNGLCASYDQQEAQKQSAQQISLDAIKVKSVRLCESMPPQAIIVLQYRGVESKIVLNEWNTETPDDLYNINIGGLTIAKAKEIFRQNYIARANSLTDKKIED